jgi:hypothetical protein
MVSFRVVQVGQIRRSKWANLDERTQLGKTLSDQQTNEIVAFLGSLTGKVPQNFGTAPVLPPGGFVPSSGADAGSVAK